MKMIANHGQQKRYYHEVVGCNSRLDSIQAAVLNIKLKKLDEYNAARQAVAAFYNNAFANHSAITTPFVAGYSTHVYHQYTLLLKGVDREGLVAYLAEHKIPSMIYYPVPGHKQDMFASFGLKEILLPVTDELTNSVISLPVHTEMNEEQLNYICTHVLNFINK
jgi:UDP-2-acetamido-2-deoxy-ribo-hexuluronate aminotransferase